jgi:helicase MOV-10
VVCSFALSNGTFASYHDRVTALDKLRKAREDLQADKRGLTVAFKPIVTPEEPVLPLNTDVDVKFVIVAEEETMDLVGVTMKGPKKNWFQVVTALPLTINETGDPVSLRLSFRTTLSTIYKADIVMHFRPTSDSSGGDMQGFSILRSLSLSAAKDQAMVKLLQPVSPYRKVKKRVENERRYKKADVFHPPEPSVGEGAVASGYKRLKMFRIPIDVRETALSKGEAEALLEPPTQDTTEEDLPQVYTTFWQQMLWMSELQAYEDVKLFDLSDVSMKRHGRLFKLSVPGLAEGRPSVLRGDIVLCTWNGKQYRGRVESVQLLDLLLQFHQSFHRSFNVDLNRVHLVRFTFSRTSFRTSHQGCLLAPSTMKADLLMPKPIHVQRIQRNILQRKMRVVPDNLSWASRILNEEQKEAVQQIVKGMLLPMPYVIFGPPGTG